MLERKLASLNEQDLFNLIKRRLIPDLVGTSEYHYSDCTSEKNQMVIELKCRRFHYDELIIEKEKYDKLIKSEYQKVRYINSTPLGIYSFNLREMDEPKWFMKDCKKTTDFEDNMLVPKKVGMLDIYEAKDITLILLI